MIVLKYQLRGPIISSKANRRQWPFQSLLALWLGGQIFNGPRESKVTNLDGALLGDQDIRRFEITMHNIGCVEELQSQ